MRDLIDRAEAQAEIQFTARRYTVAHEAHGEGKVVWSDDLISVADAMNALRKLPSVQPDATDINVGTTIYRQAAIDALFELYEYQSDIDPTEAADLVRQGIYLAEKKIEQLPSAQPERKKGEWSDGYRWQRCSLCKQTGKKSWNYCPNCGADMRPREEEQDG